MRLKFFACLLLLLSITHSLAAQGGFTTVTGTITDPNGIKYACGTISAQLITAGGPSPTLNGGGFSTSTSPIGLGCPTTSGTGAPGSFAMRLADSGVINPSNTTWKFTVNMTPGIAPPAGTGPQSFTVTTAINCGTNTPATCTANTIDISALLSASAPALSNSAVGGNSVSPKGTTDAGSSTVFLTDPKYAFPGTAQWTCQAGISNGSNIVTLPAGDRVFQGSNIRNAQIGDIVWGANAQCGGENAVRVPVNLIAQGTIASVDSPTQIHVSNNASATCVVANKDNCAFVWGPDATTALNNAWNDAGDACGTLILPAGGIITLLPPSNVATGCPGPAGGNDVGSGLTVMGQGGNMVTAILTPPIPASWNNTMFADPLGGQRRNFHDFSIASFAPAPPVLNGKIGFGMNFYGEFYNVSFLDWYPCDNITCNNTFIPLSASGVGNAPVYVHDNVGLNSGNPTMQLANGVVATHNAIQNVTICMGSASITQGATYLTENTCVFGGSQGAISYGSGSASNQYDTNNNYACSAPGATSLGCVTIVTPQTVYFQNVSIGQAPATTGPALFINGAASVADLEGEHNVVAWSNLNGGSGGTAILNSSGTVTLRNTLVSCSATCTAINNSGGTIIFKEGNTISGGPITNTGVIQVAPGGGYSGACTGVVTSATTVGLYGLGQQAATTCTSAVVASGQVATKPGTIYVLYCTATAGNQATDACTVVKNGAAQTMTCSLNAVAACTDGAVAHWVSYVAGDILGVEVIGGVATTLANVKGTIVAQ